MQYKFSKLFIVFASLMVIFFITIQKPQIKASANTQFFAQIQRDGVYLNLSPTASPIFEIPRTYYVELLENKVDGYYKARYLDIIGYVNENDIQCVNELPTTPYLQNVSFRILGEQSRELRSEPSRYKGVSTLITELPLYETNFIYYGTIEGDEVVPERSNIWYYASYSKNNLTKTGYIYSGLCDKLTTITYNPLSLYPIDSHEWQTQEPPTITTPSFEPPSTNQLIIILAISIPMIILLIALFKPARTTKTQSDKVIRMPNTVVQIPKKRSRKTDYYELE